MRPTAEGDGGEGRAAEEGRRQKIKAARGGFDPANSRAVRPLEPKLSDLGVTKQESSNRQITAERFFLRRCCVFGNRTACFSDCANTNGEHNSASPRRTRSPRGSVALLMS